MRSLLISGYKNFELGIFTNKDERLNIIRLAIRDALKTFLEEGLEWIVFTGNLGFEYWALEEALALKGDYNFSIATIFPFETHGQNWNEANQEKLARFRQVDFVKAAFPSYENPKQFKDYNQFLIDHTDGAYLFYDVDHQTSLKYLYENIVTAENYSLKTLTFEDLNQIMENFSNFDR